MAIEAVKQVSDKDRGIAGFNIHEAKFHAAMVIPTGTSGIETNFHLRPSRNKESKGSAWYEFRLCTNENDEWMENCTGSIQIVYEQTEELSEMDKRHREELRMSQSEAYFEAMKTCTLPMDRPFLYTRLHDSGYGYGDAFQLIQTLSLSPRAACAIAEVERFSTSAGETIHPTTLDAIVQTSIWVGLKCETDKIPTAVPTSIGNMWVASRAFEDSSSQILKTYATSTAGSTFLGPSVDIFAFDKAVNDTLVSIQGLGTNVIGGMDQVDEPTEFADELCHHIQWKPALELLSNKEAADLCKKTYLDLTDPEAFFTDLDFIFMARINQALQFLFEQEIKPSKPHLQKYVDWMKHRQQLLSEGQIRFASEPWKSLLADNDYLERVETRVSKLNKRGCLHVAVAQNLLKFLIGEADPLPFLFEGDMLKELYFEEVILPNYAALDH